MIDQTPGWDLAVDVISRKGSRVFGPPIAFSSDTLGRAAKNPVFPFHSTAIINTYLLCAAELIFSFNEKQFKTLPFFRINYGLLWRKDKQFNHCEQLKLMEKMSLDGKRCCSSGKKTRPTKLVECQSRFF